MGNPFYIPKKPGAVERYGPLLLNVMKMRQEGDIASTRSKLMQEGQDLTRRGVEVQEREQIQKFGGKLETGEVVQGTEPRRLSIMETQAKTDAGKLELDKNKMPSLKEWNTPHTFARLRGSLLAQDKDPSSTPTNPKPGPIARSFDRALTYAETQLEGVKLKGEAFDVIDRDFDTFFSFVKEDAKKELNELAKSDPKLTSPKAQRLAKMADDEITPEERSLVMSRLFPDVIRERQMEDIELGAKVARAGKESLSNLGKLVNEYNNLDPESPMRKIYEERMAKEAQATGEQITVGPDGTFTITKGPLKDIPNRSLTDVNRAMVTSLMDQRKEAIGASAGLNSVYEVKKLLNSGIITGTGAEYLTNMGNFLSSRLGFDAFKDPVANTQAYAATMGNQVGQIIKQFGAGTGLSDADREYAERIVGGKITLNEQAIRKLIDINEKAYRNVLTNYNKSAQQVKEKGGKSLIFDPIVEIPNPPTGSKKRTIGRFSVEEE